MLGDAFFFRFGFDDSGTIGDLLGVKECVSAEG